MIHCIFNSCVCIYIYIYANCHDELRGDGITLHTNRVLVYWLRAVLQELSLNAHGVASYRYHVLCCLWGVLSPCLLEVSSWVWSLFCGIYGSCERLYPVRPMSLLLVRRCCSLWHVHSSLMLCSRIPESHPANCFCTLCSNASAKCKGQLLDPVLMSTSIRHPHAPARTQLHARYDIMRACVRTRAPADMRTPDWRTRVARPLAGWPSTPSGIRLYYIMDY